MDASALANVSFKVGKTRELGDAVASVTHDAKTYQLQVEDAVLAQQLVNAFPEAADRKKFTLAKPFTRVFSLVEDWSGTVGSTSSSSTSTTSKHKREAPEVTANERLAPVEAAKKHSKKHKSKSSDGAAEAAPPAKAHKKHKTKK